MITFDRNASSRRQPGSRNSAGFALVSALLLLLVITLLGVSLFLGVNLEQRAAGNSMQKSRALELAQSAVGAAQQWLRNSASPPTPQTCSASSYTQFLVCAYPPSLKDQPQPATWSGVTVPTLQGVKLSGSGGRDTYWNNASGVGNPGVRITYLGTATMGPGRLYEIDAFAYGGNANSLAVVQSIYYVGTSSRNSTPAQNLGQ